MAQKGAGGNPGAITAKGGDGARGSTGTGRGGGDSGSGSTGHRTKHDDDANPSQSGANTAPAAGQAIDGTGSNLDRDLAQNPGIGQSKGAYAAGGDLADAEGENTLEGDVANDPGPQGQVNPDRVGRTNE